MLFIGITIMALTSGVNMNTTKTERQKQLMLLFLNDCLAFPAIGKRPFANKGAAGRGGVAVGKTALARAER